MRKTTALIGVSLLINNLYGGFDFGGSDGTGCEGGDGTFQQQINHYGGDYENAITVGTIPKDLKDVYISLKSDEDVDIRLYDANGKKIVHWPNGILYDYGKATTAYNGVTIEYSGYNGDGTGLGHEYIKISGTTQNDFIMKAFGYKAGYAKVDYSWAGKEGCSSSGSSTPSASGSGDFQQQIVQDDIVTVGDIPPKVNNLYITLKSDEDVDIQLYDKDDGTKIIVWPDGILNGDSKQDTNYKGMKIEWSGYNGDGTGLGHEYIKITGETTCNLTMKAYGYKAGYAKVHYEWGGEIVESTPTSDKGIISTYYDSSSRTVYVLSDVSNPRVYFAGKNYFTGNCLSANSEVHMMNFQPLIDVDTTIKGALEAKAKAKGLSVNLSGESSSTSSYKIPSVYYYNFNSLTIEQLHYNILAEKDGKVYSSGWLPDSYGGCTYTPNPLK